MSNAQDDTSKPKSKRKPNQLLKLALEVGPLAIFFLLNAYASDIVGAPKDQNIFYATGGFMIAIAISLITSYALHRTLPIMPIVTGVFVFVFGGLTLYLQDEQFIKLKPTIANLFFAAALLGGLMAGKPTMKVLFDGAFRLTDKGWSILTLRWGLFFLLLALINEIVWRNFTTDQWVDFKVFGLMPLTMVFAMAQLRVISKHALDEKADEETEKKPEPAE